MSRALLMSIPRFASIFALGSSRGLSPAPQACMCRATIIGATSFGKGVIQYYFPIGQDGAGLKLTVAKYLTPGGHDISKTGGLKPDVQCHAAPHVQPALPDGLDGCVLAALLPLDWGPCLNGPLHSCMQAVLVKTCGQNACRCHMMGHGRATLWLVTVLSSPHLTCR